MDDFTVRPLTMADAASVFEVMSRQELHDLGSVEIELADIVADWQRPSFDIPASTIGVFDNGLLVGYAEFTGAGRGDAAVVPEFRSRGIGTWLARWMQDAARSAGSATVRMPVLKASAGDRLLEALGYQVAWTSWMLYLPQHAEIEPRPLPDGFAIRDAHDADDRAVWTLLEDAFGEWADRERESFEDFLAVTRARPGFEPWNLRVVTDPAEGIVAAVVIYLAGEEGSEGREGWVDRIAVRRDRRGRGLAQSLLASAFTEARRRGAVRSGLSTDSRTGALDLYRKLGMEVTGTWLNRAISVDGN
ncbi:MAG: GNAT family N-acetyltransferase [Nocardioides sp.]